MKATAILLLCVSMFATASAFSQVVTLSEKEAPIEKVFNLIKGQTGYEFLYTRELIYKSKKISIQATGLDLKKALDICFLNQSFRYEIVGKTIVLKPKLETATTKRLLNDGITQSLITGFVKDSLGQPVVGASVNIKGLRTGTSTNANGVFNIDVLEGNVLIISFVGYITQEIKIDGFSPLNIVLLSEPKVLEQIVVTALGISKSERKLGYATTKLDGDLLNTAKEPNIANSLGGRVSGLNVSGVNSGPGASARILIRGITNFSSSTGPLIVLDGVPMDNTQKGSAGVYGGADMGDGISSINPDDVENVVVLKGSTASALYGTRAANGVIQITTKSGKAARGFGIEYSSNISINSIVDNTDYQKVYGHGVNGKRPATYNDLLLSGLNSWGEKLDAAPAIAQDGQTHPYSAVRRQQQKFYKTAPVFVNTISFVNGGENGNVRLSLSHTDNQSVIPNSNLKRYNINLNLNQNITQKLKLNFVNNYINEQVNHRPFLNDMSRNPNFTIAILPANISPEYLKPGFNAVNGYENAMNADGYQTNPWFAVEKFETNTKRNRIISSTTLRYDFTKNFYAQGRLGFDYINDALLDVEPTGTGYKRRGGLGEQSKAQTTELNIDGLIGYSVNAIKDVTVDVAVGANSRRFKYEKVGTNGQTWNTPFLYTVSNLTSTNPVYAYLQKQTNSGYYTADFSYKKYITVSTTGRYDVFSTLPKNSRAIFSPSVSSSIIFSEFLHIPRLNFGKLRLSYAQTSGEADPYQTSLYYQIQPGDNNGIPFGNTLPQTSNVEGLKPYRLKEFEVGLELKWFGQRLGLDITYFSRRTSGELIAKAISIASGYTSAYEPLGSTQNNGVELLLNATALKTKNLQWNFSFNFTQVNNKLLSIGDEVGSTTTIVKSGEGQYRPSVGPYNNGAFVGSLQGKAISQIMAYDYLFSDKGEIVIGSNGIPLRGGLTAMGSGLPKYYGGLNNEISFKGFVFGALIDYRFGSKILSGTDFFSIYYGLNKLTVPGREIGIIAKGVTMGGKPNTTLVNAEDYYKGLATNISTISVFDGSFIKLRQMTLGYGLPDKWFQKTAIHAVRISLLARNLLTLMRYTRNFDPEDSFSSLPGNAGLQGGGMPPVRTYGININMKFKK